MNQGHSRSDVRRLLVFLALAALAHLMLWLGWQGLAEPADTVDTRATLHVGLVMPAPSQAQTSPPPRQPAPAPRPDPAPVAETDPATPAVAEEASVSDMTTEPSHELVAGVKQPSLSRQSWYAEVNARIARELRYPRMARLRGLEGQVLLSFELGRDGSLVASSLARSSGHETLDHAALTLLERAAPFPAPPSDIEGADLRLQVPINYSLER